MMERQFLFCLVLLAIPALTIQQACPDGHNEVDGRCFFISDVERTYHQAKYDCMYRGGSLVTIDNAEDREDAMEGSSGPVAYWVSQESLDVDFNSDAADLNCYICEASPVGTGAVQPTECSTTPTDTDFDYEATTSLLNDLSATLDPDMALEVGVDAYLNELGSYEAYDGTPTANLPNTTNMTIMHDYWTLSYTAPGSPIGLNLIMPETENFDPNVGLPATLPGDTIAAFKEVYPLYSAQYLTDLETNYATWSTTWQFDEAVYGPNADCPYPPSTELGGGFTLEHIGTTICYEIETHNVFKDIWRKLDFNMWGNSEEEKLGFTITWMVEPK